MQRRVEQPDRDRPPGHRREQALEVLLLQRQQLGQRGAALRLGAGHDHRAHLRLAVGGHEHVLGPAQADALGAVLECLERVGRRVGVGAHAEPADVVGPAQHALEALAARRLHQRHVVERDQAGAAVDGDPLPGADDDVADADVRARRSISSSPAPTTAGRPMPRATSAACDAFPPSDVRIPRAAWKPATSSASVNGRTRMTSRALRGRGDRLVGGEDDLALGRARRRGDAASEHLKRASGSNAGCSSASSAPASMVAARARA